MEENKPPLTYASDRYLGKRALCALVYIYMSRHCLNDARASAPSTRGGVVI